MRARWSSSTRLPHSLRRIMAFSAGCARRAVTLPSFRSLRRRSRWCWCDHQAERFVNIEPVDERISKSYRLVGLTSFAFNANASRLGQAEADNRGKTPPITITNIFLFNLGLKRRHLISLQTSHASAVSAARIRFFCAGRARFRLRPPANALALLWSRPSNSSFLTA